jgi:hypothetical protein
MALSSADQQARSRFQSGLLAWLRAAGGDSKAGATGLREMVAVVRGRIEDDAANLLLWRSAEAFLNALLEGSLQTDEAARLLCRRIERQLGGRGDDAGSLGDAIFAFVSNRVAIPGSNGSGGPLPTAPSLNQALNDTLGATADVLPLLAAKRRRFSDELHTRWQAVAKALQDDWHSQQTGRDISCRGRATELVALALELGNAAALRLAEAIADAASACEERTTLESAVPRAAFSAALEVVGAPEGPEQNAFDHKAGQTAQRLQEAFAAARRKTIVPPSTPWFAADAHEWLDEMRAALDAVPPQRLTLASGFEWLAQQQQGSAMAMRGLATLAGKLVWQMRSDDLDTVESHRVFSDTLAALAVATDELAAGHPPKPDEAVFARLRQLQQEIDRRRTSRKENPAPPDEQASTAPEAPSAEGANAAPAQQSPADEG